MAKAQTKPHNQEDDYLTISWATGITPQNSILSNTGEELSPEDDDLLEMGMKLIDGKLNRAMRILARQSS